LHSITRQAQAIWGDLPENTVSCLRALAQRFRLSISSGDLQLMDGKWYVTHSGLLRIAKRSRCSGITTSIDRSASDASCGRWVFKATVYKAPQKKFVGHGDADPSNVSPLVRGAEMRIAETRAVNRALRKAYGIGLCSVEELGSFAPWAEQSRNGKPHRFPPPNGSGSSNGAPKLRDRLCVLVRKYDLDAAQVKRYAADFCGTEVLRDASRDVVESFITTLEKQAANDRDALVCKLNSYTPQQEVHS
jgi:hypothetical protein